MRQKQQEAVGTQPLGLAGGDELIDHDLRAVGDIAELGFPEHQRFGIGERIAVFETEHAIFGERRIEHLETAMLDVIYRKSVLQGRSVSCRVDLGGCRNIKKNKKQKTKQQTKT